MRKTVPRRPLRCRHSRTAGTLAALGTLALVLPASATAQGALTPDQRIAHVLNRTGYGVRAGDVAKVRAKGIEAYLEEQLHPERIADRNADAKLAPYAFLRMSLPEAMDYDRPAAAVMVRRMGTPMRLAYRSERANGITTDTTSDRDSSAALRRSLRNTDFSPTVTRAQRPEEFEIYDTRLIRAVYSERQLLEVMVEFWFNHFNIQVADPYYVTHWTEQVIRPHALGKFEDLLYATVTHPAMMLYLDNWLSAAPDSVIRERLATWQPPNGEVRELAVRRRAAFFARTKGLNENYARELMELHTLGVDGGYTQKDVLEVARAFTGWTLLPIGPGEGGGFLYEPLIHEDGDKVVLGRTIKSGGMEEGKEILRMLTHHPSTARYVSFKLARHFVGDDPPEAVVNAAAKTFQETRGDIPAVLRTIFRSREFFSPENHQTKIKTPLEMLVSTLRAVNADIVADMRPTGAINNNVNRGRTVLTRILSEMGQPMGRRETPDGYPDVASAWMSTSALQQRVNFALALTSGQYAGITVDVDAAGRVFRELGYAAPTPLQISQAQAMLVQRAARGSAAAPRMGPDGMMQGRGADSGQAKPTAAAKPSPAQLQSIAMAIHLGSPRFQKR